jgi:hypothetical protein
MKFHLDPTITYKGVDYQPKQYESETEPGTWNQINYYIYDIKGFCVIVSIDGNRPANVMSIFAKKGGTYEDLMASKNITRDNWIDQFGCEFDELDENIAEMLDNYETELRMPGLLGDTIFQMGKKGTHMFKYSEIRDKAEKMGKGKDLGNSHITKFGDWGKD